MKYISKTQFQLYLRRQIDVIEELEWDKITPIKSFNSDGEGIMLLLDRNKDVVYVSATNNFNRRLVELFEKENTNGRFDNVDFIQVAKIDDYDGRIFNRKHLKETLEIINANFANVLDDDDPRIQAIYREIEEIRQEAMDSSGN